MAPCVWARRGSPVRRYLGERERHSNQCAHPQAWPHAGFTPIWSLSWTLHTNPPSLRTPRRARQSAGRGGLASHSGPRCGRSGAIIPSTMFPLGGKPPGEREGVQDQSPEYFINPYREDRRYAPARGRPSAPPRRPPGVAFDARSGGRPPWSHEGTVWTPRSGPPRRPPRTLSGGGTA